MSTMQSAMNYLKRRFSDTTSNSNLPNGYMIDVEPCEKEKIPQKTSTAKSAPVRQLQSHLSFPASPKDQSGHSGGFFASLASGNPLAALRPESTDRCRTILVVDDQHTDWSKYFRNKRLHGECPLQVEQAEFKEITLSSHSHNGVTVDINCFRNGNKIVRSLKPDFLMVRQPARSMVADEDFRNLIIGLKYGGVPSINSLHSQYNFTDKAWIFAQLIRIQKKLGKEKFPLIEQTYYPSYAQMVTSSHYPIVLKIGHAHRGMAKFKVNNHYEYQDVVSGAALTNAYIVVEQYVEAKHDIRVQKIGGNYKSFIRTSVSKNWKANTGSAALEEVPLTDRHKLWVDACSDLFGGLDMVAVKAVRGMDEKDYILGVADCSMPLIGEKQDEDRRMIVDLVLQRMTAAIRPRSGPSNLLSNQSQSQQHLNQERIFSGAQQEKFQPYAKLPTTSAPPSCVTSAPPSCATSAPPSISGSEPPSPSRESRDELPSKITSEDEESKAEKIRSLRQSFANFLTN